MISFSRFVGRLTNVVAGLLCLCMVACGGDDDDYVYPPIISELVDMYTDSDAVISSMQTDGGERYVLRNKIQSTDTLTKDSTYRCICRYIVHLDTEPKEATVYSLQTVRSPLPVSAASIPEIHADPVSLQSIWQGGKYLNLCLLVKVQNKKHTFLFLEDSLSQSENGQKNLHLKLYHDAGGDVEAYTQSVYLSIPLYPYEQILQEGDTVSLRINTKKEGWKVWKEIM